MKTIANVLFLGLIIICLGLLGTTDGFAQINTIPNGGFEQADVPAYWSKLDDGDADVSWATDQFRSPQRSLKISEASGPDAPAWISDNMAKLQWNPTTGIPPNIEIEVGGWIKTENVNTNPATADDEIQLSFSFYDASENLIFGQPVVIKVPQANPSIDWTEIKNDVSLVLPTDAASLIIKFQFGANATGTVWLDDIFMRLAPGASGWIGDLYNANFGVPAGWFFWKGDMSVGNPGKGVVTITSDYAHKGSYSLLVEDDASNPDEVVAISDRNPIEPGRSYGFSAWVKTVGVNPNPTKDVEKAIFFTLTYHTDAEGWAEVSGEDFFIIDQTVSDRDWTLYTFTFTPPENATRVSIRPRLQHQATGKVYWDDFRLYPVEVAKTNFTFDEIDKPAYWNRHNYSEATVQWATDQYRSPERSLKISDDGGTDEPLWLSTNMAKLQWNPTTGIPSNIEIEVGGWVKTENVNTNPASDDQKVQLIYSFFDAAGNKIFGQDVVLDVPQSQASSDWTEIKNSTPIVLPVDADSLIITFKFGANATGTVWLDDIFMRLAPGASGWIGDLYNANFGVPEGWFFWKDHMSEGEQDFGIVTITDKYAHSGKHSLLVADDANNPAEVVAISNRNPVKPNTEYLITAWVKLENAVLNPEKDVEKSIFFTVTYHSDAEGWAENWGQDFFVIPQTVADRDWGLYSFRLTTRENDSRISIRARLQHQATGNVYWDDFQVVEIATPLANLGFEDAEMPAYWTKQNEAGATVEWATDQVRSPQRSLKISDDGGTDAPAWVTNVNMATLQWNPTTGIPANIEIEVGGWVKTENVNTNPATADDEIHLIYSFFDNTGALIFGQPIELKVPQSSATVDWTEIKNDVSIVLPTDAASLSIAFQFGANATGTVWLDDIFMRLAPGASGWIGDLYNANFGVPRGWFFWKGQMSEGVAGKGVVTISRDYAHTGDYSLLVSDDDTNPDEVVAISDRNPIEGNKVYTVQAYVKTEGVNLNPPPIDVEKAIFFTVTYHTSDAGWAEISGQDFFVIDQTVADKDWTLCVFTLTTPENATRMSIRPRLQHQATGKVYWDDLAVVEGNITKLKDGEKEATPLVYRLTQNYPNPFNPETIILYTLPSNTKVSLAIYNLLGQKIRSLVDADQLAGEHQITWDGLNDAGEQVSSGVYYYILVTKDARLVRKMTLVR